jgi:cell fate regulator YaaT (PSP1 superfamily)
MPYLIEVAFKGNRKDFFLWDGDDAPPLKAGVIVDADRGEDLGFVFAVGDHAEKRNGGVPHGYGAAGTTKKARRLATAGEIERAAQLRVQDEEARRKAMERVKANDLVMKLSDAEWQWDQKKLTLYFTAETRVDFRTLVRELASIFRTRIELKQIGVRDEAKRLDGIGRCGRQYCSASWLPELRPVNLGVAKDQRLSLNPSQISGACGRLMCCLRYEHEFYVQSRKRFPKEGKIVRTKRGEEKVLANDIFRERVTLRGEDGEVRAIELAELHAEVEAAGGRLLAATGPRASAADDLELEDDRLDIAVEDETVTETVTETITESIVAIVSEDVREDQSESADEEASEAADGGQPQSAADGRERRPHRRRGRRGGRRNRQSGGPAAEGGDASTPPPREES